MDEAKPTLESPINDLVAEIATAMHSWHLEQQKVIAKKVTDRLDQHRDEILMKLMGFAKESWKGGWVIDHCNGRSGNSIISDFLKEQQEAAIKDWLSQIPLPTMSPAFKARIAKEMQRAYESEINSKVYPMARAQAERDLAEFIKATMSPPNLTKYLQMQALVNPPTTNA